jgi:NADH dehydrogenase
MASLARRWLVGMGYHKLVDFLARGAHYAPVRDSFYVPPVPWMIREKAMPKKTTKPPMTAAVLSAPAAASALPSAYAPFDVAEARVTVFGGTGFLGRYVVRELARRGALIRVISRDPQAALELKTFGYVGQITLEYGSLLREDDVQRAVANSDAVVNLVGILYERGRQRFASVQAQGAERIAKAAAQAGVKRLVHISALGVDRVPSSKYARTKLAGERAVQAAFPAATILRPSVVFGAEDQFFNRFASLATISPFMPLIGGGKTRFQPVYAGDVAQAVVASLCCTRAPGRVYELGGPTVQSFHEILTWIMNETGHRRPFLSLPFAVAGLVGAFAEWLPVPPLTRDQVRLLKADNVVSAPEDTLQALGVEPRCYSLIMPEFLHRYRKGGHYTRFRAA